LWLHSTPLNCIIGLSSLLQETELTAKQQESLRMINTSGELLCTVVNDILDYSKLQSGNVLVEMRETNLQDILDSVVNSFEHKARSKQLGFKTLYAPSVPEVIETDSNRLQQILYNLLGNAVKFSEPGGSVELTVELLHDDTNLAATCGSPESTPNVVVQTASTEIPPSRCPFHRSSSNPDSGASAISESSRCPFSKVGDSGQEAPSSSNSGASRTGTLTFTVKDYGRGIDQKDFARIFEPFGQASAETSRIYGGTGLGLAITSKLVERLGGTISVESELGDWSKFTVALPMKLRGRTVEDLVCNLTSVDIVLVDHGDDCNQNVFSSLDLPILRLESCEELGEQLLNRSREGCHRDRGRNHRIYIVHEDLYDSDHYRRFAHAQSSSPATLVSFGPKRKQIAESREHFRSISDRIPCVLVKSLVSLLQHQDQKTHSIRRNQNIDIMNRVEVLMAEDNLINQKVLYKMLQRLGVERIDIANNGKEAVDMSANKRYDVIFMDMQMPVMCGDEACRIICDRHRGEPRPPKIAFLSAHASSNFVSKARAAGAEHFLSKPFNIKAFELFIRSLDL
jgi:two-component system, sensor histidine kinase and response regulator